jgi:PTH1 family peptidyl-tRNA hydrolase
MDHTLIIGLGNPDPLLKDTYHNVGMLALDRLVQDRSPESNASALFRPYKGIFEYAKVDDTIFMKPLVFMNESGIAVKEAMRVFKASASDIAVIHDDSDIMIGDVKYSSGGGSAGHKGIRSIIDHIKTPDFYRIRVGIRERDEQHRKKAEEFVLSPISTKDKRVFEDIFKNLAL